MTKELIERKNIGVPSELWKACLEKAENRAQTLSAVIRKLLEKWLRGEIDI